MTAKFLTIDESAAIAKRSRSTIFNAMRAGKLRVVKRGRRTLVPYGALRAWLGEAPAAAPRRRRRLSAELPERREMTRAASWRWLQRTRLLCSAKRSANRANDEMSVWCRTRRKEKTPAKVHRLRWRQTEASMGIDVTKNQPGKESFL